MTASLKYDTITTTIERIYIMTELSDIIKETIAEQIIPKVEWQKAKYLKIKQASTTEKGRFGENLIVNILKKLEFAIEIIDGGVGDFDTLLNNLTKMEHKTATIDVGGCFQFNAIKKGNIDYDLVFCLGVSYDKMYFEIISKQFVEDYLTTNMTKAGGGFKYTSNPSKMQELTLQNLKETVAKIV